MKLATLKTGEALEFNGNAKSKRIRSALKVIEPANTIEGVHAQLQAITPAFREERRYVRKIKEAIANKKNKVKVT